LRWPCKLKRHLVNRKITSFRACLFSKKMPR
jgi:hypothetical protein